MSARTNFYPISSVRIARPSLLKRSASLVRALMVFLSHRQEEHASGLRIEERLHLGPKKSLLLVNCHGRRFLVATAGETIASLIEVGMPDEQPAEQAARSRKGCAE